MGANAQTTVPTFVASQVLTADQQNQSARTGVPVFATTITRDAAFGGTGEKTLAEGQLCFIEAAPKRLQMYNGSAWVDFDIEYQAHTPSWVALTIGNGTNDFEYARIGQLIHWQGTMTFGSTTSVTSNPIRITPPVNSDTSLNDRILNAGVFYTDASVATNNFVGVLYQNTTSVFGFYVPKTDSTYLGNLTETSSTVPFTWTTGDKISFSVIYKVA